MDLMTSEIKHQLLANWRQENVKPVVKYFTPDAGATWLISEMDPEDEDTLFGLCDLGLGTPELGYVLLSELMELRGMLGLPVERDLYFEAKKTLVEYADEAADEGRIQV